MVPGSARPSCSLYNYVYNHLQLSQITKGTQHLNPKNQKCSSYPSLKIPCNIDHTQCFALKAHFYSPLLQCSPPYRISGPFKDSRKKGKQGRKRKVKVHKGPKAQETLAWYAWHQGKHGRGRSDSLPMLHTGVTNSGAHGSGTPHKQAKGPGSKTTGNVGMCGKLQHTYMRI